MTITVNALVTPIIELAIWSRMIINKVTHVPFAELFAPVISNAPSRLMDGVPVGQFKNKNSLPDFERFSNETKAA